MSQSHTDNRGTTVVFCTIAAMGYRLAGHLLLTEPDRAALERLPEHVGYRVFKSRLEPLWVLETFRVDKPPKWPLTTLPAAHGDAADFAATAPTLAAARQIFDPRRRPPAADHWTAGRDLSRLLQTDVLTFAADDELLDGAAIFSSGRVARLREYLEEWSLELTWSDEVLIVESRDVEGMPAADHRERTRRLEELRKTPGVEVKDIAGESSAELFRIVVAEVKSFAPAAVELLGLGTWEPGMKPGAFEQVAQRLRDPAPAPTRAPAEAFAYPVTVEPENDSTALPAVGEARIVIAPDESSLKLRFLTEQPAAVMQRLGAELQAAEHRDRGAAESVPAQQMMMNPQLRVTGEPALQRARLELLPDVWVTVRFTGLLRQRGFDLLMRLYRQARRTRAR